MLCTDPTIVPEQIIAWFVRRWQMETTFAEVRRHLGVETQRQWTDKAIGRTTPALLGLFSLVTLLAHPHLGQQSDLTGGVVPQAGTDLRGRADGRATGNLGTGDFSHVG